MGVVLLYGVPSHCNVLKEIFVLTQLFLFISLANLMVIASGMNVGWSSPFVPMLESGNYTFQISAQESSLLVILPQVGEIIGPFVVALLANHIGRKAMINASAILIIIAWILFGTASSAIQILIGRFITGISNAISFIVVPIYLIETASPKTRGHAITLCVASETLGELLVYMLGAYVPLNTAAFISICLPVLCLVTFPWMPESPYFYLITENPEKAKLRLQILRCREEVSEEFHRISTAVKEQNENKKIFVNLFTVESNRKTFAISVGK